MFIHIYMYVGIYIFLYIPEGQRGVAKVVLCVEIVRKG